MTITCGQFIPSIPVTDNNVPLTCGNSSIPTNDDLLNEYFNLYAKRFLNTASLISLIEALGYNWEDIKKRFDIERPDTSWETKGMC